MEANSVTTLLNLPDETIEMIFDNLNFEDRLNFAMISTKTNKILSGRKKYWKDICFTIQKSQKVSEITRPYANIIWNGWKAPEVSQEVWAQLATNMNALKIEFAYATDVKNFIDALPYFVKLVHLKIGVVPSLNFQENINHVEKSASEKIEMKNLEHLEMRVDLFMQLNNLVNFSTSKLKTFVLLLGVQQNNSQLLSEMIVSLISRQINLETLRIEGDFSEMFNQPLDFNFQLKQLTLNGRSEAILNEEQQDNWYDFMESQKNLKEQSFYFRINGWKTIKMKSYYIGLLDLPLVSQKFEIHSDGFHSSTIDSNVHHLMEIL